MGEASTFGKNLRRLREQRGLSQNALARRASVSQGFLHDLESGRRVRATTDTALAFARALDVTVDELLRDGPQEGPGDHLASDAGDHGTGEAPGHRKAR